ncbi:hypothetical protein [Celeribacter sp. ULVN23_4]
MIAVSPSKTVLPATVLTGAGFYGWTTKVHAPTDEARRPIALCLTPGQTHDLIGIDQLNGGSTFMPVGR